MGEPPDLPHRDGRDAIMQRVRVGVTGLAAVFLLTLLAASVLSLLGQDAPPTTHADVAAGNVAADAMPKEPLAELGVAPGNAPKKPVSAPKPLPAH